jgi:transposase, IS30 family
MWSPTQISRRLGEDYPDDPELHVSHETICECLYLQARGAVRTEVTLALGQGGTRRVHRSRANVTRGTILDMVNVGEWPVEVAERAVPGFWEGGRATWKAAHSEWSYRLEVRLTRV